MGGGGERVHAPPQLEADTLGLHHRQDVVDVLGELRDGVVADPAGAVAQRPAGDGVGAGSASDAEVDPTGVGRLEQRELLGDHERRVVGQHHPATADPDPLGGRGEQGDDDRRVGRGHRRHVVVLGDPVALVAVLVGGAGQSHGRPDGVGGGLVGAHRHQVEDGQAGHGFGGHHRPNHDPSSAIPWAPDAEQPAPTHRRPSSERRGRRLSSERQRASTKPPRPWLRSAPGSRGFVDVLAQGLGLLSLREHLRRLSSERQRASTKPPRPWLRSAPGSRGFVDVLAQGLGLLSLRGLGLLSLRAQ